MKTNFVVLIISMVVLSSCNLKETIEDLTTFEITNSADFTIPGSSLVDVPINVGTPDVTTSSEQSFENNNTRAELVQDVNLSELKLTITNPSDRDFSFLKSLKIFISNDSDGETLLAEIQDVPESIGNELDLETTGENLDAYIKKDSYNLKIEAVTDETVNSNTDITADMVFEVRAKVL